MSKPRYLYSRSFMLLVLLYGLSNCSTIKFTFPSKSLSLSQTAQAVTPPKLERAKERKSSALIDLLSLEDTSKTKLDPWTRTLTEIYINNIRLIEKLPSKGKQLEISNRDTELQRLLKQRLNVATELYRLTGLRLQAKLLQDDESGGLNSINLSAIQIVLAEADLTIQSNDKMAAYETCQIISQRWLKDVEALERAGVGTRDSVLTASYWKQYCESQKMKR